MGTMNRQKVQLNVLLVSNKIIDACDQQAVLLIGLKRRFCSALGWAMRTKNEAAQQALREWSRL